MRKKNFTESLLIIINSIANRKKYDNIIPLGYNCEIAYRFYKHFKFIDSSLFAWVYISSFEMLMNALNNLDKLAQGELVYENTMFKCLNSGIYFHGRTSASEFNGEKEHDTSIIKSDIQELRPRIKYLSEKFLKLLNNGKNTLFIKKISSKEASNPNIRKQIINLYDRLKTLSSNNFDLLLVTEQVFFENLIFKEKNIHTRFVKKYSPDETVTDKKAGDKFGWDVIFMEFAPKKRVWKKKKLKFEEV